MHEYKGSRLAMVALTQAEYKRSMCTAVANFLQNSNITLFISLPLKIAYWFSHILWTSMDNVTSL